MQETQTQNQERSRQVFVAKSESSTGSTTAGIIAQAMRDIRDVRKRIHGINRYETTLAQDKELMKAWLGMLEVTRHLESAEADGQ